MEVEDISARMGTIQKLEWIAGAIKLLAQFGLHTLLDLAVIGIVEDALQIVHPLSIERRKAA